MATSLSAGIAIYDILSNDETVSGIATKIFPVLIRDDEDVQLPYVCYHRERFAQIPMKSLSGSDTVNIVVDCYAETYLESVELAEAVRAALDFGTYEDEEEGIELRSCYMADAQEYADEEGHFVQQLMFNLKI